MSPHLSAGPTPAPSPRPSSSHPSRRLALLAPVAGLAMLPAAASAAPVDASSSAPAAAPAGGGHQHGRRTVRIATYNASLNRDTQGALVRDLTNPGNAQAAKVAEIIQRTAPDIVLINEFDHDAEQRAADLFRTHYLQVSQRGQAPIDYPYAFSAPVNTGEPSGMDLDQNGTVGGPGDAYGFGLFPGQYGMLVLSRFPIDTRRIRTFQNFLWSAMPDNLLPTDYYPPEQAAALRLSSKSHWDVPVRVGGRTIHVLAHHPTPPSFDGPEDRNGRRNHDEIRLWADYLRPGRRSRYLVDDAGVCGGLGSHSSFVILGDHNSDPADGDSWPGAIQQLLDHPRVQDARPTSRGAVEAAEQGGANTSHRTRARYDTADFTDDPGPGNLRVDYVLPSRDLRVEDSGVFWPRTGEDGADLVDASDHRLVHVDLRLG